LFLTIIRLARQADVKWDSSPFEKETGAYDKMEELDETEKVYRDAWD
jgi:hypothetical protein